MATIYVDFSAKNCVDFLADEVAGFWELRPMLAEVGGVGLEPLSTLTGVGAWGCTDFLIYEIDKIRLFVVALDALDTEAESLIDRTASSAINKKGKNKLRVVTSGSLMEFYINGTMVNSITDDSLTEGKIRLYVANIQEIAFDNLEIKVIGTNEQPLLKSLSE